MCALMHAHTELLCIGILLRKSEILNSDSAVDRN